MKKRLKRIENNQAILNAKLDLLLEKAGLNVTEVNKAIGGGGIKPPQPPPPDGD